MRLPVGCWSKTDKIAEAIRRSKSFMPQATMREVDALLSPENLAITVATLALWGGSHLFGVGEIVDVALLLVGAFTIGWSVTQVLDQLFDFGATALRASSDGDLDRAARSFASAVIGGGLTAVMAILLRRSAARLQAARDAVASGAAVAEPRGLVAVGAAPCGPGRFGTPTVTGLARLPAGEGHTTPFGDVTYSTAGTATERQLARLHELVHAVLSPRLRFMRTFRARLAMSAYSRSAILLYLEEALAETFAQLRVNGFTGVIDGLRFPIANGYLSLQRLLCEGAEIGKIVLGAERFSVQYLAGPSSSRP